MTSRASLPLLFAVIASAVHAQGATSRPDGAPATRPADAVLFAGPFPLPEAGLQVVVPAATWPRLLVVRGSRSKDRASDARLDLEREPRGPVSGFEIAPGRFFASLPLDPEGSGSARTLFVRPLGPGVVVDAVEIVRASRVKFTLRDQATKNPIPGIVQVTALEGSAPPLMGCLGSSPRESSAWITSDGFGDLYLPLGSHATFVARTHACRAINRQRHRVERPDGLLLNFLLPADQLPEGARIIEAPDRFGHGAFALRDLERALGIGRRPADFRVEPADADAKTREAIVARALVHREERFLFSSLREAALVPAAIHPLSTVELPGGDLLHTNGPVLLIDDLRREGEVVRGWIKIRVPDGVLADHLQIRTKDSTIDESFSGPTTVKLALPVPSGTPFGLVVTGPGFAGSSLLERPFAFRTFTAP